MKTKNGVVRMFVGSIITAASICSAVVATAGDEPAVVAEARVTVQAGQPVAAPSDHWIGVLGMPADEVLKLHLKIDGGLVVQDVVAESPAAAAGVQKYDILLKFNDAAISDLETLAAAIAESRDAEATLAVIRAGKQRSLKIKPAPRPADAVTQMPVPRGDWGSVMEWLEKMRSGQGNQGTWQMWFYPPGIVLPGDLPEELRRFSWDETRRPRWMSMLPQGASITVNRAGDEPAKIVVKRGDETWTVDENQLDQLPEDLRGPVRDLLESGGRPAVRLGDLPRFPMRDARPASPRARGPQRTAPEPSAENESAAPSDAEGWGRRIEEIQKRIREHQQRIEQEMERLRRDLQQPASLPERETQNGP
ncbi:MAG: PDZ domain-containing protein [Pirellulaceae bacterium]|nr:PDZ domain-containing protein [Pirellulaceae bacterium]